MYKKIQQVSFIIFACFKEMFRSSEKIQFKMNKDIISKYSVAVPRYTSYPPANFFTEKFTRQTYRNAIADSNVMNPQEISFYVHIPFCQKMCHYCGCNSMLLENKDIVSKYISALKKEIQLVLPTLKKDRRIAQIHYGGGSPTSLPVSILKEINDLLLEQFETIKKPEIAIECHPGYLDQQYWIDLIDAGFNRISLGIQDFDEEVLKIANRKSSRMPVGEIVKILKDKGISVNMDFIYGLPKQTSESFQETITKAIEMRPDRIVTFSYAHVPWVNEAQMILEKAGLPDVQEKNRMYEIAKELLIEAGYEAVGLDHFVLPNDELFKAQQEKKLHRNFQGYCTRSTTGQVYGFGVTAISQLATAYSQNVKDLKKYIEIIDLSRLPVLKGYRLNDHEQIAREVITSLMCNYFIRWEDIAKQFNISVEEVKAAINYDEKILTTFTKDGLIEFDNDQIIMRKDAAPYVRNVAASLDKLMINTDKRFSKVS